MDAANLFGNLIFSGVGFVAFAYGKKQTKWRAVAIGLALMFYPWFVPGTVLLYAIGLLLTAALFIFPE